MHLLERYATSCGVKIDKPYIYECYFPTSSKKYITFQPFSKPAKNYDYWQEVIDLLHPYLSKNNIDIIQIGAKDDKSLNHTFNLSGQTTVPQAAFLIKNSLLHLGADSFATHVASGYGKKIVALYSNNNIENVKPYWSDPKDIILLRPEGGTIRPSYSLGENPKNINRIKSEDVARAVLGLLNIKEDINQKTVYIGSEYQNRTLEIIPDKPIDPNAIPINNPIIRMDYLFNEEVLAFYLQFKKCIIFTNKSINEDLLKTYKANIGQIIYILEEDNDVNFIRFLKNNGISYALISYLQDDDLNKFKLDYMDYGLILSKRYPTKKSININGKDLRYISGRIVISSEGQFNSKFSWLNKNQDKVIDTEEFWKEADNFYIFDIDKR